MIVVRVSVVERAYSCWAIWRVGGWEVEASLALRALPVGTRVERYLIQSVIAGGGFGITYVAEHELLKRRYAIKEHFPEQFAVR